MFEEPFADGQSIVHTIDPRCRLMAAFAGACAVAVVTQIELALFACGATALLLFATNPPKKQLFQRLFAVNFFIFFLWIIVPFTTPGEKIAVDHFLGHTLGTFFSNYPFFTPTREGLQLCVLFTLKSNAIIALFLALIATMHAPHLGHAMERLHCPAKLVFLFLFTYRYIHDIGQEWQRLQQAAVLRGFVPRTNLHTLQTEASILGMVLIKSHQRSQRVYEAMLLRGFHGSFSSVTDFHATIRDKIFLGFSLSASLALLIANFQEYL